MALDAGALAKQMLGAALGVLGTQTKKVGTYAELEFKKLADTMATLEKACASGELTLEEARVLLEMQKGAARSVLLTVEGLGVLAVENALNAALDVIRAPVNAALGFALL